MIQHQRKRPGLQLITGINCDTPDFLLGLVWRQVSANFKRVAAITGNTESVIAKWILAREAKQRVYGR